MEIMRIIEIHAIIMEIIKIKKKPFDNHESHENQRNL